MKFNFPQYVNNLQIPYSKTLYPLFEAISNSIDAIEDLNESDNGEIIVTFERLPQTELVFDDANHERLPIQNILIEDNGIGFNEKNFNAFNELSTESKKGRGGKGLGRVCWLKVFAKAEIQSSFSYNESVAYRKFQFSKKKVPIKVIEYSPTIKDTKLKTSVKLIDCKKEYKQHIPKRRRTLALEIITHFLPYFMTSKIPKITLREKGLDDIQLDLFFEEFHKESSKQDALDINGEIFNVVHSKIKRRTDGNDRHRLHYIADGRVVNSENITQEKVHQIPDRFIEDDEDHVYVGYVEADYLNSKVNQTRDGFIIEKSVSVNDMFNIIGWDEIHEAIFQSIESYLHDHIGKAREEKNKKIKEYISTEAQIYKYIFNEHEEELDRISTSDIKKKRLDTKLHEIHTSLKKEYKKKADEILGIPPGQISKEEYQEKIKKIIQGINSSGKAELAQYIMHRKVILSLLNKALNKPSDGKFSKEDLMPRLHEPPLHEL